MIKESIDNSGLSDEEKKDLDIAIIGGSLRIPFLKQKLIDLLRSINGKEKLVQTMNMDESAVRGCGYYYLQKQNIWNYQTENRHKDICVENINDEILFDDIKKSWDDEKKMELADKKINEISKYKNDIDSTMYIFINLFIRNMFNGMRDDQIEETDKEGVSHCIFQLKTFAITIVAQPEAILKMVKEFYEQYCRLLNKYDESV